MPSLLELCRQCGLAAPGDYVLWPPFGVMVTEIGERKLMALARQDPGIRCWPSNCSGQRLGSDLECLTFSPPTRDKGGYRA
jgi:hypothetical protein